MKCRQDNVADRINIPKLKKDCQIEQSGNHETWLDKKKFRFQF